MAKSVLSHTTLERKIRLIFGLLILLIIVATLFWPWWQMEELVSYRDLDHARDVAHTEWLKLHLRGLLSESEEQVAKLQLFEKLAPSPAQPKAERPRFIQLDAPEDQPERRPQDALEERWLGQFAKHSELSYKSDTVATEKGFFFRYAYAMRAGQECLDCHRATNPDLKANDLMGALVVSFPTEKTRAKIIANRAILIGAALVTAILSMIAFYGVLRWVIVQPVAHLKKVADRVTNGDLHVRADITTGDEFEGLSRSFNRMLQRLEAAREELRRANLSLDQKLEELARANVSLFEMNQMKTKFLTTMSHELRTPLNAILGFAEVLEENDAVRGTQKLSRYVQNIQNSGRLLLDIINDMLDLAKIEAGKMELKLGRASPLDLSEMTMNMVRPLIGKKELRLELEVSPDCPIMTTDANKLQQVLYNLLSNAVKFTPAGVVRMAVRPIDSETILFQVSDSGPGLTPQQQKMIFDRFSQVDSGHTRQYSGTGLGLSIVRELVSLLGGEVAVQSELGQGATFNVTLPIVTRVEGEKPGEPVVMRIETKPAPKEPTDEKAPERVTPEDTIVAVEVETDILKPPEPPRETPSDGSATSRDGGPSPPEKSPPDSPPADKSSSDSSPADQSPPAQ